MIAGLKASVTEGRDQSARTTQPVYELARRLAGVPAGATVFDPCPADPALDGLSVGWKDWNYVNPPFREAGRWVEKGLAEAEQGRSSFFLLPLRASRRWFADRLVPVATISLVCQPVRFFGYSCNFSLPVVVARIPPAVPPEGFAVRQWTISTSGGRAAEVASELPWDAGGVAVVTDGKPSASLRRLPREGTVLMPVTLFKTKAFRERLRDVRDVAWVRVLGAHSFVGSAAVRLAPSEPPAEPAANCLFLVTSERPLFPSHQAADIC